MKTKTKKRIDKYLTKISKIKLYYEEYKEENNVDISFKDFFIKVLQFTENDLNIYSKSKEKFKKKPSGESKKQNKVPSIKKGIGDIENPEYEKYYNMVLEFRKYMCNKDIRPEGDEKKTMRTFMKYAYNLEGDAAVIEMRKIENIVYKNKKSFKNKRNVRRAKRAEEFNEKFNLT